MATYRPFLDSSGRLQIDVDGAPASNAPKTGYVRGLVEALEGVSAQTGSALSKLPPDELPAEVVLAFDITALDGGGFGISRGGVAANFHVSMRWSFEKKGADAAPIPGLGAPAPQ